MPNDIWPFKRPSSDTIEFGPWLLSGQHGAELPEYLEGWDPQTDVSVERTVRCNLAGIRTTSGLPADARLTLTVSWANRQSFATESVYRRPLGSEQIVSVSLPASKLGGSIVVRTTIALATSDPTRPLGVARLAGSILRSHEQIIVLEGNGPMFPISTVDFSRTMYSPDASWALELPDDLSLPVLGSVLLLINSRDSELATALAAASPDPRQTALVEHLESRIGVHLMAQAVALRSEIDDESWEDQSVGDLLQSYLLMADRQNVLAVAATGDQSALSAALDAAVRAEGLGRRFI